MCNNWSHRVLKTRVCKSDTLGQKLLICEEGVEGAVVGELSSVYSTSTSALLAVAYKKRDAEEDSCLIKLANNQYAVRNDVAGPGPVLEGWLGTASPGWKANTSCRADSVNCDIVECTRRTGASERELYVLLVLRKYVPTGGEVLVGYPLPDGVPCRCGATGCVGMADAAGWVSDQIERLIGEADLRAMVFDRDRYRGFCSVLRPLRERFRSFVGVDPRPFEGITKSDGLIWVYSISDGEVTRTLEMSRRLDEARRALHDKRGWPHGAGLRTIAPLVDGEQDHGDTVVAVKGFRNVLIQALAETFQGVEDRGGFVTAAVTACVAGYTGMIIGAGAKVGWSLTPKLAHIANIVAAEIAELTGRGHPDVEPGPPSILKTALAWGRDDAFLPPGRHGAMRRDLESLAGIGYSGLACAVRLQMWSEGSRYSGGAGGYPRCQEITAAENV
jgi:hypothetical protein